MKTEIRSVWKEGDPCRSRNRKLGIAAGCQGRVFLKHILKSIIMTRRRSY
jgi:hypothetical protein